MMLYLSSDGTTHTTNVHVLLFPTEYVGRRELAIQDVAQFSKCICFQQHQPHMNTVGVVCV